MLPQPILEICFWSKSRNRDSLYQSGKQIKIKAAGKATAAEHSVIRFNKGSTLPAPLLTAQHAEQQHENGIHKFRSQAVRSGLNLRPRGQDTTICDPTSDFSNQQWTKKDLTHDKRSSGQSGPAAPSALSSRVLPRLGPPVKYDQKGTKGDLTEAPAHMWEWQKDIWGKPIPLSRVNIILDIRTDSILI